MNNHTSNTTRGVPVQGNMNNVGSVHPGGGVNRNINANNTNINRNSNNGSGNNSGPNTVPSNPGNPGNRVPSGPPRGANGVVGVSQYFPSTKPFPSVPYTDDEFLGIQNTLDKTLGPEYVSSRPGAGGTSVAYIEGWKALNIANEIFGFNGWSSELVGYTLDFCDIQRDGRISMGLSVVVRVTIKDGTYHEDIGYGHIDNAKSKAAAYEKCKKEALTDGVKRCLRCFGNVLGNCLYDKALMAKLRTVEKQNTEIKETDLYRDDSFVKLQAQRRNTARVNIMPNRNEIKNNENLNNNHNAPPNAQRGPQNPQNSNNRNPESAVKDEFKTPKNVPPSQDEFDDSFLFSDEVDMNRTDEFEMEMIMNKSDKENEAPGVDYRKPITSEPENGKHTEQQPSTQPPAEPVEEGGPALFVSAKRADLLKTTPNANIPQFDPKFVSPSIRRSLDPTKSVPVKRTDFSTSQTPSKPGSSTNIINPNGPSSGTKRMIGMPLANSNRQPLKRLHKE